MQQVGQASCLSRTAKRWVMKKDGSLSQTVWGLRWRTSGQAGSAVLPARQTSVRDFLLHRSVAGTMQLNEGEHSRPGCGSARPRAELERSAPHQTVCTSRARCGPRGRGPLRPGRARSPFQLHRSGLTNPIFPLPTVLRAGRRIHSASSGPSFSPKCCSFSRTVWRDIFSHRAARAWLPCASLMARVNSSRSIASKTRA